MNTKIYIVVVLVAVLIVGVGAWLMLTPEKPQAVTPPPSPVAIPAQDSTAAIFNDLNAVELGNIDQEFKDVDADLNAL